MIKNTHITSLAKKMGVSKNIVRLYLCDGYRCERVNSTDMCMCDCPFPDKDGDAVFCTLPKGHEGPHIACGMDDPDPKWHNNRVWL